MQFIFLMMVIYVALYHHWITMMPDPPMWVSIIGWAINLLICGILILCIFAGILLKKGESK